MPKRRNRDRSFVREVVAPAIVAVVGLGLIWGAYYFGLIAMVLDPVFAIFKPE